MLRYILSQVAPALGIDVSNADNRAWVVEQINKAAKELYEGRDLANVEREQALALEGDDQMISLPYYMSEVRGVRRYTTRDKLNVQDMRPRYKTDGWANNLLTWREKWKSPLKRNITNEAPVTLTIPDVEAAAFSVVISGSTPNSARVSEEIVFPAGTTEKTSVNTFTEIFAFSNLAPHTYDVTMEDVDGVELSVLPNVADAARYIVVQVLDSFVTSVENPYIVEVLYKNAFLFMRDDFDDFVCPGYDDAIVWQTLGNTLAKTRPAQAAAALIKVSDVLRALDKDKMQSKSKSFSYSEDAGDTMYPFGHQHGSHSPVSGTLFPGAY